MELWSSACYFTAPDGAGMMNYLRRSAAPKIEEDTLNEGKTRVGLSVLASQNLQKSSNAQKTERPWLGSVLWHRIAHTLTASRCRRAWSGSPTLDLLRSPSHGFRRSSPGVEVIGAF